jgi:predicted permease
MSWLQRWRQHRTLREDLAEEMEQHLQEKAEVLGQSGMSRAEALSAARRSFGNQALLQDRSYEIWQGKYIAPLLADFKFGWGQLKRAPLFTLTAILIFAIGIGANTAVFSLFYAVILRNLPVHEPARLAFVQISNPKMEPHGMGLSYPMLEQLRKQQHSFTDISGWSLDKVDIVDEKGLLRSVFASEITGNSFEILGVKPALGRMLAPSDDIPRGPTGGWPVVLSYSFWKQNFHGDPDVLGKTISISDRNSIIVGVTPAAFEGIVLGLPSPPRVFLPLHFLSDQADVEQQDPLSVSYDFRLIAIGRLKSGISLNQANTEIAGDTKALLNPIIPPGMQFNTYLKDATLRVTSASQGESLLEDYRHLLTLLQTIMAAVLFLCCFNVMGMQLARTSARRHEFAIRVALGATRWHIVRQSIAEVSLLVTGGTVLAVFVSYFSMGPLSGFLTRAGSGENTVIRPDWSTFAIAGAIAIATTLSVGILPALIAGRTTPGSALKSRSSSQRRPTLGSRALVPMQIALSFVLIIVAGLFISTLLHLRDQDMGFRIDHVIEVSAQFQRLKKSPKAIMDIYRQIVHQLRAEPGIQTAAITWITPMTGFGPKAEVYPAGGTDGHRIAFNQVGPGYFETLQINLLAGRGFTDEDKDRSTCIVNRVAQRLFYAGSSALDGELEASYNAEFSNVRCRIVGIVQDAKYANIREPDEATLYFPITTDSVMRSGLRNNMVFLMKADTDQSAMSAYRKVLTNVAPTTPFARFLPLRTQMKQALGSERLLCLMSVLFGAIALPLCGIGIFGLLATRVEQRTSEVAIRLALGASRMHVLRQVLREGMSLLGVGLVIGIPALFFATKLTQHFLFETSPINVRDIGTALLLLTLVALCAAFIPGWRAARLDPLQVLRRE